MLEGEMGISTLDRLVATQLGPVFQPLTAAGMLGHQFFRTGHSGSWYILSCWAGTVVEHLAAGWMAEPNYLPRTGHPGAAEQQSYV